MKEQVGSLKLQGYNYGETTSGSQLVFRVSNTLSSPRYLRNNLHSSEFVS